MSKFWRYYCMITSGVIAELLTFIFLWNCTSLQIFTVIFWMCVMALAVGGVVWTLTDPMRKPWSPDQVPFVKIDKKDYGHHDGYIERRDR